MAGYIFTLGKDTNVFSMYKTIAKKGIYGTYFKKPKKNYWTTAFESTFCDYLGMREGDHVYFFFERKIYGIGELVNIGGDVKHLNYPGADFPVPNEIVDGNKIEENDNVRVVVTFKSSPFFFEKGIDMDVVLQSSPEAFKMLRAMWKVSFKKIDEKEDNALFDIILRENKVNYLGSKGIITNEDKHDLVANFRRTGDYNFTSKNLIQITNRGNSINHEMVLECDIVEKLTKSQVEDVFGVWDYVSHQVVASPFKPIDYMDKIDVFGYEKISGFESISRYMCIEIKKDAASKNLISQVMKYVDWIKDEYAYGDYSMIEAYVVAHSFSDEVIEHTRKFGVRNYTKGVREEMENCVWDRIHLIQYRYDDGLEDIIYEEIK